MKIYLDIRDPSLFPQSVLNNNQAQVSNIENNEIIKRAIVSRNCVTQTFLFPTNTKVPYLGKNDFIRELLRASSSRRTKNVLRKGVQVNLFKCRSIQKGSLTQAHPAPLLSVSSRRLFLFLALFCHSTCTALSRAMFASTTRARDNDRDIRFSNLFINALMAPFEVTRLNPVACCRAKDASSPSLRNRQVTPERLHRGQGLLSYQGGYPLIKKAARK